ncbi:MAG: hypothetical protein Q8O40_08115 [Chloroflexota bacterium]|nr:hypothetical protein [Chloroflexota bacterium]
MNPYAAQIQVPMIPMQQPAPYVPATVAPAQAGLDISSLINSILPIFMLMMVMGMLMPMMKGMTGGLGKA